MHSGTWGSNLISLYTKLSKPPLLSQAHSYPPPSLATPKWPSLLVSSLMSEDHNRAEWECLRALSSTGQLVCPGGSS